jgi:hypothetical protein
VGRVGFDLLAQILDMAVDPAIQAIGGSAACRAENCQSMYLAFYSLGWPAD